MLLQSALQPSQLRLQCVLQLASGSELAEVKRRVGVLKRVCRQRTQGAWKEWRTSMEQHRAAWLASHLELLQQDHAHLQAGLQQVHQLRAELQQLQTGLRDDMTAQRSQWQVRFGTCIVLLNWLWTTCCEKVTWLMASMHVGVPLLA